MPYVWHQPVARTASTAGGKEEADSPTSIDATPKSRRSAGFNGASLLEADRLSPLEHAGPQWQAIPQQHLSCWVEATSVDVLQAAGAGTIPVTGKVITSVTTTIQRLTECRNIESIIRFRQARSLPVCLQFWP
jgi:hypothetical protein